MKRRLIAAATAALLAGVGTGVAFAVIHSTGSGTGSGATASMSPLNLLATPGTPSTALLPGGSGDVTFEVSNPNAVAVTITTVVGSGSISVSGGSGCTSANDGVTFTNQSGLSIVVPAHATSYLVDLSGAASMTSGSANGCQGATFSIPVTVTAVQG